MVLDPIRGNADTFRKQPSSDPGLGLEQGQNPFLVVPSISWVVASVSWVAVPLSSWVVRLDFLGSRLDFLGSGPDFLGSGFGFLGSRPAIFLGNRLDFLGSDPGFLGSGFGFLGSRPAIFLGSRLDFLGSGFGFLGSRPAIFLGSGFNRTLRSYPDLSGSVALRAGTISRSVFREGIGRPSGTRWNTGTPTIARRQARFSTPAPECPPSRTHGRSAGYPAPMPRSSRPGRTHRRSRGCEVSKNVPR